MSSSAMAAFPSSCHKSDRFIDLHKCHASSNRRMSMNVLIWLFVSTVARFKCDVSTTVDKFPSLVAKHNSLSHSNSGVWSDKIDVSLIFITCLSAGKIKSERKLKIDSRFHVLHWNTYCWLSIWNKRMPYTIYFRTPQTFVSVLNPIKFYCNSLGNLESSRALHRTANCGRQRKNQNQKNWKFHIQIAILIYRTVNESLIVIINECNFCAIRIWEDATNTHGMAISYDICPKF